MTDRLPIGTRVIVALPGLNGKQKHGVIVKPELVKGYWVLLDGETEPERFHDKKVKCSGRPRAKLDQATRLPEGNPLDARPPTRLKISDAMEPWNSIARLTGSDSSDNGEPFDGRKIPTATDIGKPLSNFFSQKLTPQAAVDAIVNFQRPSKPEQSEAYKAWIRTLECCNCGTPGPGDPHHEGKKGMSQKVRDTLCVPLCRPCHTYYTATNRLPDQELSNRAGKIVSRSRDESLAVLQGAQAHLVAMAFERLPLALRVEVLSKALANVGEDVLRQALR